MRDLQDYSLKTHNTFGIDAKCSRFMEYESVDEAQAIAKILCKSATPYIIIGGGSNLLLTKDYEGIVVRSDILGFYLDGDRLICGSGEVFDEIVEASLKAGLYGLENLSLIPGDVGASAVQNIGAYGVEAKDFILSIEAVEIQTGQVVEILAEDCWYAYRQSRFKQDWKNKYLITHVTYRLSTEFKPRLDYGNIRMELERKGIFRPTALQLRETIIEIRKEKLPDPKVIGNAGSFFMNPIVSRGKYEALAKQYEGMPHYEVDGDHVKIPAGWMIDQCGWKGKSLGRAGVHDKQALVLVNRGGATGEEIVTLCETVRADVKAKFGIEIYPEVNII
ncbi:MAG: UDP-N-acetylmuramate dehydrogenase [Prevotella sp.]|nr:UDP-N-acetylmuramate dehydrogenase [Prevotella sp.]MBO7538627.1 UDP-N-acetylmuramate dehydrogenase [Prevotella sp.]